MDAMLNWLWQGSVVAVVTCVMLLALSRARANARYIVCWAAALFVIALPTLPQLLSAPSERGFAAPVEAVVSLPDAWWTSTFVIRVAWTLWAVVQIVRFVSASVAVRRARAGSCAFPAHVESMMPHWRRVRFEGRRATLVLSESVTTAAVLGWGTPTIAIAPSLVTTLDVDELDRVLIHEWAHVQRRDDLVNVLQVVIGIAAGWHPALRWLDRRLHVEREIACDEMAVAVTGSPKSYAACLMKIASVRHTRQRLYHTPAVLTSSGLRARVLKIVSPYPAITPVWSRSIAAAMVVALCVISTALARVTLVEATALALPFVAPRTLGTSLGRPSTGMTPTLAVRLDMDLSSRRIASYTPASERSVAEPPSASRKNEDEPNAPLTGDAANLGDSTPVADVRSTPAVQEQLAAVPNIPSAPSAVTPEPTQSPWTAAAAGGVAIGRKSKEAGVATAGFFTRFARRVAGSF